MKIREWLDKGDGVLSNEEIIKHIDFEDNTDQKHGRYDFSFTTYDKQAEKAWFEKIKSENLVTDSGIAYLQNAYPLENIK